MKKILFVEDDLMIIRIYRTKFQSEGFEVDVATDGQSALDLLKKSAPDLVLLDLQLPKVNGVEVLKHIRSRPETKSVPVIVFSNAFMGKLIEEAWKAGATKCMTKANCTPSQLIDIVRSTLENCGPVADAPKASEVRSNAGGLKSAIIPSNKALADLAREATSWSTSVLPGGSSSLDLGKSRLAEASESSSATASSSALSSGFQRYGESAVDAQSQGLIRRIFLDTCPHTLSTLRSQLMNLTRAGDESPKHLQIAEIFRTVHSITGNAGLAGFRRIGQVSASLEALLQELQDSPKYINASSLRTLAAGVDAMGSLFQNISEATTEPPQALALVVDDDVICCRAVCSALDKVSVRSIRVDDSEFGLRLAETNRFDLIFLDVEMPNLDGYQLATKLRAAPINQNTPIIFVTSLNDFEGRARSQLSGGNDLIAKPFLLIELAVKALTFLAKPPMKPVGRAV